MQDQTKYLKWLFSVNSYQTWNESWSLRKFGILSCNLKVERSFMWLCSLTADIHGMSEWSFMWVFFDCKSSWNEWAIFCASILWLHIFISLHFCMKWVSDPFCEYSLTQIWNEWWKQRLAFVRRKHTRCINEFYNTRLRRFGENAHRNSRWPAQGVVEIIWPNEQVYIMLD